MVHKQEYTEELQRSDQEEARTGFIKAREQRGLSATTKLSADHETPPVANAVSGPLFFYQIFHQGFFFSYFAVRSVKNL